MKQRFVYILVSIIVAVVVAGCDYATEITTLTTATYVPGPLRPAGPNSTAAFPSRVETVWLAGDSALYVKVNFPNNLPAGNIKAAQLVLPVIPQNDGIFSGIRVTPNLRGPHLKLAAHRILDPYWDTHLSSWLGETHVPPSGSSVATTPSATDSLFGPGFAHEYSHVRLDITDMMQAWYAGEPNYGLLVLSDPGPVSDNMAGWKHVAKTVTPIRFISTRPGVVEQQRDEPQSEKVRVVVTWTN